MAPRHQPPGTSPADSARPYRGPDRRGVARFVVPVALPTAILVLTAALWVVAARRVHLSVSGVTLAELGAISATLAFMAGLACLLRWRLDGIARGWWCGWALLLIGVGHLTLGPIDGINTTGGELAMLVLAMALITRAVFGPEVDTTIRVSHTLTVVAAAIAVAILPAVLVGQSPDRAKIALGILGGLWIALGAAAVCVDRRGRHDAESGWIVPLVVALGLAELVPLAVHHGNTGATADRWFELCATGLAAVGALGGLVRAAVHHRTRALREQVEREREYANHQRVEENFADRLHEMRSTVVAIEGGVATWATPEDKNPDRENVGNETVGDEGAEPTPESTLRAALIAEIRRLRTLVNESPTAAGVEAFDLHRALEPTVALHRASGQEVEFRVDGTVRALGRPAEVAQVVEGLLANAAKYAPGAPVTVVARHELDEISVRVEDDGPGINPEFWDNIFERGFRVDPLAPLAPEGSGLGLAVARKLIRSQDGDLWVAASPSGGAAFVLSIPAAPALRIVPARAEDKTVKSNGALPVREAR